MPWKNKGTTYRPTVWAELPVGLKQTLLGLIQVMEAKDPTGSGHSARVAAYGAQLARIAGLSPADLPAFEFGSLLHDIGKAAVSDQILHKPGRLTPAEYQAVMAHPVAGAWLLRPVLQDVDPRILDLVLYHHEHYDGSGYPEGLSGEAIPLWARICSIADAWDVMTSLRPYRSPFSLDRAVAELGRCAGTQFDPELTRLFIDQVIQGMAVDSGLQSGGHRGSAAADGNH